MINTSEIKVGQKVLFKASNNPNEINICIGKVINIISEDELKEGKRYLIKWEKLVDMEGAPAEPYTGTYHNLDILFWDRAHFIKFYSDDEGLVCKKLSK